jgi:hypothetical protein
MPFQKTCTCGKEFIATRQSRNYCSRSCSAKAVATRLWKEGRGNGFQVGHPVYLIEHSKETKEKLREMFKGKHISPNTEFKIGHETYSFKGMFSYNTRQILSKSKKGRKNPNYGKPLSEEHKQRMRAGFMRALARYGVTGPRIYIPWIDYQLISEEQKGAPKKNMSPAMRLYYRKKGLTTYKGHDLRTKREINQETSDRAFKVGNMILIFDKRRD